MTAVYPGTFDPVTYGHMDQISRAASMFDRLIVGVLENRNKKHLFSAEERTGMLTEVLGNLPNVEIISYDGFAVNLAKSCGASCMVRGLRCSEDFEYELKLAQINRKLAPEIETVFLASGLEHSLISSSAVREIAMFGGDLSEFVPPCVEAKLREKYRGAKSEQN